MNLAYISFGALTLMLLTILIMSSIDYRKRRVLKKKPLVSFLITCYNDGDTVENTIRSIYRSYHKAHFEMIIADDKSTDSSTKTLERLKLKYGFTLVKNTKNIGKSSSLNNISKLAKNDILICIDTDGVLNRKSLYDLLARLEGGAAAASCPYRPKNKGFYSRMQEIEYNMLSLLQGAHNITSTLSLWGGCIAVKRSAFLKAGMFSPNAIVEDMDLALKLNELGYRVEQSFIMIESHVPDTFRSWYKQKIRWTSGGAQCLVKHLGTFLRSPLHVFFLLLFSILSSIYFVSFYKEMIFIDNVVDTFNFITIGATKLKNLQLTGFYYGAIILKNLISNLYFTVFSIPYVVPMLRGFKDVYKFLYLIPFSLLYYPVFVVVSIMGTITYIKRHKSLEKGERAW